MKTLVFAGRNGKELLRDPLSLVFGVGLPLVLLVMIEVLQQNIEVPIFQLETFAPGIAAFSLSFIALFTGMLVSKDRTSAFLLRLFSSPMSASDFIFGYTLPLVVMSVAQTALCFLVAGLFGLTVGWNTLLAMVTLLPAALLYIGLGLLFGCILQDKQIGGVMSLFVNLGALASGMWFDLAFMGDTIRTVCYCLPFAHALDAARAALTGDYGAILPHVAVVAAYAAALFAAAVLLFRRRMKAR